MGEISQDQAAEAVRSLDISIWRFLPSSDVIDDALILSAKLDHSVYDCVYLAATLLSGDRHLVTTDNKFAVKAAAAGYGERLLSLDAAYARLMR